MTDMTTQQVADDITQLRRRYDELTNAAEQVQEQLATVRSRIHIWHASQDVTDETDKSEQELEEMEDKLDDMALVLHDDTEKRKTFEQIIKRLKQEATGYDKELTAIHKATVNKAKDFRELKLMMREASAIKDEAKRDLAKVEAHLQEQRRSRKEILAAKRRELLKKQEATLEHQRRSDVRREELSLIKEETQKAQTATSTNDTTIDHERQQIKQYEDIFRQMKEVTGVSSVSEIIEKFLSQEDTHNTLAGMTKESQARIDELNESRIDAKKKVEKFRYSGIGTMSAQHQGANPVEMRRKQNQDMLDAMQKANNVGMRNCKTTQVMVDVKAGTKHLMELLSDVPMPEDTVGSADMSAVASVDRPAPINQATQGQAVQEDGDQEFTIFRGGGESTITDDNLLEVFDEAVERMWRVMECIEEEEHKRVGHAPPEEPVFHRLHAWLSLRPTTAAAKAEKAEAPRPPVGSLLFKSTAMDNLRIRDPLQGEDDDSDDNDIEDPDNPIDPVLDRETIKKQSKTMVKKRQAKVVKRKKGDGEQERPASAPLDRH